MNLDDLKKEMLYKWRVQSFSQYKPTAQCVAYIDARDVMDRLDEVCGIDGWQSKFYEVNGMLFCSIGIKIGDAWVEKSDTGSESNIEKEKGHASDAFKRTAVMWGIGRFLYSLKIHSVNTNEKLDKVKKNHPHVVDAKSKRVWDLTEYINSLNGSKPEKAEEAPDPLTFEELKEEFSGAKNFFHLKNAKKKYASDVKALPQEQIDIIKDICEIRANEIKEGTNVS